MSDLVDPKTINYPSNRHERETYMRLKLARGERFLDYYDIARIERARFRRSTRISC